MKLILAQPAIPRFQWELDVLLTNIKQFTNMEVVLLFTEHDFTVPTYFRKKFGCSVFVYTDRREDMAYIPSVRPWLLWQYFREHPNETEEAYFYIDSDIIFREWPDFTTFDLSGSTIYGADCDGYIGYNYIANCTNGLDICTKMAEICAINVDQMKSVPGIGAQLVFAKLSAEFWERCYYDSNTLYHYLQGAGSNIQSWTAEMWAQQWGWVREGISLSLASELNFCTPTDPISHWDKVKILHNAGVMADKSHILFYKGQYVDTSPLGKNFDWVDPAFASRKYADAVEKVLQLDQHKG